MSVVSVSSVGESSFAGGSIVDDDDNKDVGEDSPTGMTTRGLTGAKHCSVSRKIASHASIRKSMLLADGNRDDDNFIRIVLYLVL